MTERLCAHCKALSTGLCRDCKNTVYCSPECQILDYHIGAYGVGSTHATKCSFGAAGDLFGADRPTPVDPNMVKIEANHTVLFRALSRTMDIYHAAQSKAIVGLVNAAATAGVDPLSTVTPEAIRATDTVKKATEEAHKQASLYMEAFMASFVVRFGPKIQKIIDGCSKLAWIIDDLKQHARIWQEFAARRNVAAFMDNPASMLAFLAFVLKFYTYATKSSASVRTVSLRSDAKNPYASAIRTVRDAFGDIPERGVEPIAAEVVDMIAAMKTYVASSSLLGDMFGFIFAAILYGSEQLDRARRASAVLDSVISAMGAFSTALARYAAAYMGAEDTKDLLETALIGRLTASVLDKEAIDSLTPQQRGLIRIAGKIFFIYAESMATMTASQFAADIFTTLASRESVEWLHDELMGGASGGTPQNGAETEFIWRFVRFMLGTAGPLMAKVQQLLKGLLADAHPLRVRIFETSGGIVYPRMGPTELHDVLEATGASATLSAYVLTPTFDPTSMNVDQSPGKLGVASIGQAIVAKHRTTDARLVIKLVKPRAIISLLAERSFVAALEAFASKAVATGSLTVHEMDALRTIQKMVIENELATIAQEFNLGQEGASIEKFRAIYGFTGRSKTGGTGIFAYFRRPRIVCRTVAVFSNTATMARSHALVLPQERAPGWTIEEIIEAFAVSPDDKSQPRAHRIRDAVNLENLRVATLNFAARWVLSLFDARANPELLFHADLHAGNLFYNESPDGISLVPIDFGNVQRAPSYVREQLYNMINIAFDLNAVPAGDLDGVERVISSAVTLVATMFQVDMLRKQRDIDALKKEMLRMYLTMVNRRGTNLQDALGLMNRIAEVIGLGNPLFTSLVNFFRGITAIVGTLNKVFAIDAPDLAEATNQMYMSLLTSLGVKGLTTISGGIWPAIRLVFRTIVQVYFPSFASRYVQGTPYVPLLEVDASPSDEDLSPSLAIDERDVVEGMDTVPVDVRDERGGKRMRRDDEATQRVFRALSAGI